jgi:hypothetical protein
MQWRRHGQVWTAGAVRMNLEDTAGDDRLVYLARVAAIARSSG